MSGEAGARSLRRFARTHASMHADAWRVRITHKQMHRYFLWLFRQILHQTGFFRVETMCSSFHSLTAQWARYLRASTCARVCVHARIGAVMQLCSGQGRCAYACAFMPAWMQTVHACTRTRMCKHARTLTQTQACMDTPASTLVRALMIAQLCRWCMLRTNAATT